MIDKDRLQQVLGRFKVISLPLDRDLVSKLFGVGAQWRNAYGFVEAAYGEDNEAREPQVAAYLEIMHVCDIFSSEDMVVSGVTGSQVSERVYKRKLREVGTALLILEQEGLFNKLSPDGDGKQQHVDAPQGYSQGHVPA